MNCIAITTRTEEGFMGYVPDIKGCVAFSPRMSDLKSLLAEAIVSHCKSLQDADLPLPEFNSVAITINVPNPNPDPDDRDDRSKNPPD